MRLTYFGRLGDVAGCREEAVDLPSTVRDTASLRRWLDQRFETDAFVNETVRIAIDDVLISAAQPIEAEARIAFLPPVGGG